MRPSEVPRNGRALLFTKPKVHFGFLQCWTAAGFHQRVLGAVKEIAVARGNPDGAGIRLTVTDIGPSLQTVNGCGIDEFFIGCTAVGCVSDELVSQP
jgi:hypothetical protein